LSNRYFCKKPHEKRAEAKGERRISKRGSSNRRVIFVEETRDYEMAYHATKGWRGRRVYDVAPSPAGLLFMSFLPS